ncbi:MAG: SpoIIE family protein phosphatase [Methanomicrobium sp.]|nr:SpoIIE family protein phosphatase [Methanomicrobium sp.]
MVADILSALIVLLQLMCVIVVAAYLLTRSSFFKSVLLGHPVLKVQALLILFFGALSIYGTAGGVEIVGVTINVRDLGPMVGGLVGGPVVGLGSGLIGAAYRAALGGFTVIPCVIATILAGLFGGIIWILNKRKFVSIKIALVFAVLMEALHMGLVLAIPRPFSTALEIVETVSIPMILANAAGVLIFAVIIKNLENEQKMRDERDTLVREMERKDTELAIAGEIQQSFLPEIIPQVEGFDVAGKSLMAKEVGGDFFDVIPFEFVSLSPGRMGVLIADVSGKGVPAALFMALSRIIVRVNANLHQDRPDVVMHDANNLIAADSKAGMFVTLFYGILDRTQRSFKYVNAGHNPPMVYHSSDKTISELESTGIAMGAVEDAEYGAKECPLQAGDIMVLYTDGITEAMNEKEEMYGEERLSSAIKKLAGMPAKDILQGILDDVRAFSGNTPQYDDITLMVIRVSQ